MLELVTAPTTAAVTLADAKAWLRVDHATDDAIITALVRSCEVAWEVATGMPVLVGTYRADTCAGFAGQWCPPRTPVVAAVSVNVLDLEAGTITAVAAADWRLVRTAGGQVFEIDAGVIAGDESAQITWTAGYAAVQPLDRAWLLRSLAAAYRFRGDDPEGRGPAPDNAEKWLRQAVSRSVLA